MQPAAPRRKGEATGVKVNRRRKTASQLSGGTPGSLKDADPAKKTAPFLQVMRDWHRLHPDDAMPQDMLDAYSLGDLDEAYRLIGEEAEKEGGVEPEENEEAMRREGMHKLEERLASGGAAREDVGGAAAWAKAKKDAAEHGHVDGGVGAGYEVFDVQAHDPGIDKGLGDVEGQVSAH